MSKNKEKTSKNIIIFKESVKLYKTFFNLEDWNITVDSQVDEETEGVTYLNDDMVTMNSSRRANICYSIPFIETASEEEVRRVAFHEVLEVYFSDIRVWLGNNAAIPSHIIDAKIHSYINLFENKILNLIEGDLI